MVIGEEEEIYAEKLASYIRCKESGDIQVSWYVDKETLLLHRSGKDAEIFLLGNEFCEEEFISRLLDTSDLRIPVLLTQDCLDKKLGRYPSIPKYQPAKEIVRQIYCIASELLEDETIWTGSKKQIKGIFAPWNDELSMLFSLTMAQVFAEEQKVVCISQQECYGIKQIVEDYTGMNLSDAVSILRKQSKNPGAFLKSMLLKTGKADYLPPAENPQNLYELTEEDYRKLMNALEEQLDHELILWEAGTLNPGLILWIEKSQVVYCPYQEEVFLEERKRQLTHIFQLYEKPELFEKLHFVHMPHMSFSGNADIRAEQLPWSELGIFLREQVIKHGI